MYIYICVLCIYICVCVYIHYNVLVATLAIPLQLYVSRIVACLQAPLLMVTGLQVSPGQNSSAESSASADQLIPGWAAHWDGVIQAPVDHLHIQTQRHNELGTGTDSLRISTGTAAWQMLGKCLADAWLTWPLLHSHCFLFCAKSITVKVSGSLAHLPHLSLPMFWQSQSAQQKNL